MARMARSTRTAVSICAPRRNAVRGCRSAAWCRVPADKVGGPAARRGATQRFRSTLGRPLDLLRPSGMGLYNGVPSYCNCLDHYANTGTAATNRLSSSSRAPYLKQDKPRGVRPQSVFLPISPEHRSRYSCPMIQPSSPRLRWPPATVRQHLSPTPWSAVRRHTCALRPHG